MALLIDGYNLMHAAGLVGQGLGPGGLERSRLALLNFVAASVEQAELAVTTIVFDAQHAPPGLPGTLNHRTMTVRFSSGYDSADELIEELIRASNAPRRLLVVSSDHRLQRAAKHRRAKAIDADVWYAQMVAKRAAHAESSLQSSPKPNESIIRDVDFWLRQFGDDPDPPESDEIFPPGYGEDVEH
jgi:uncharacterized protein